MSQDYSMDCYFRQYWRDKRLSFKSPIKELSLSIKVSEELLQAAVLKLLVSSSFHSVLLLDRCSKGCGSQTLTSTTLKSPTSTQ